MSETEWVSWAWFLTAMAASLISIFQPNLSSRRITIKPLAVLNKSHKMRIPYELKQGQTRFFHQLPSGLNIEVIEQKGTVGNSNTDTDKRSSENPPLVFVHGSYHAAWCWAEHWFPFFSSCGYDCYALSLLGQVIYLFVYFAKWLFNSYLHLSLSCLFAPFLCFGLDWFWY